jgi:hypothetical protein
MAAIDKIYGTQKQYNELKEWLKENQKPIKCKWGMLMPGNYLYPRNGYNKERRPISNFPHEVDKWLLKNCPIEWVTDNIKEQYGINIVLIK